MVYGTSISSLTRKNRRLEAIAKGVIREIGLTMTDHMDGVIKTLVSGYRKADKRPSYTRTDLLRTGWLANLGDRPANTSKGLVLEITNAVVNQPKVGLVATRNKNPRQGKLGKPYADIVHGSADGKTLQAHMHINRWPSLYEAIDRKGYNRKIRAAVRQALAS